MGYSDKPSKHRSTAIYVGGLLQPRIGLKLMIILKIPWAYEAIFTHIAYCIYYADNLCLKMRELPYPTLAIPGETFTNIV